MKLLIVYATTEGQTEKVCSFFKEKGEAEGHEVKLVNAADNPSEPEGFDRVIVAASMHNRSFQNEVSTYVEAHHESLNAIPSAFVTVSLAATEKASKWFGEGFKKSVAEVLQNWKWQPAMVLHLAGALKYLEYDWLRKFALRLAARSMGLPTNTKKDHEFTDWQEAEQFLHQFLETK